MAWYTDLFCCVEFYKETYNTKEEVESELDEAIESIKNAKTHLRDLVFITEPKKFCDEDEDPNFYLSNNYDDWMEILEESIVKKYKLELLLENWNACHNEKGLAIHGPKDITYETAFLRGTNIKSDIKTIKE